MVNTYLCTTGKNKALSASTYGLILIHSALGVAKVEKVIIDSHSIISNEKCKEARHAVTYLVVLNILRFYKLV